METKSPARFFRIHLPATLGLLLAWLPQNIPAQDPIALTIRAVAFQGDTMPGIGEPLASYNLPLINENGDVAFVGSAGSLNAVWKEVDSVLELVVKEGDTAPGTGGATFDSFEDLVFNDAGEVAFVASLSGVAFRFESGIWAENGDTLEKVVQRGDVAPIDGDPENRLFERPFAQDVSNIFPFVMNNQGTVALYSELRLEDLSPAGETVFTWSDGVLSEVGSTRFPGVNEGLSNVSNNNTLGDNGTVGIVTQQNTTETVTGGMNREDTAPDTGGATFLSFGRPDVNATGEVVVRATLAGSGGVQVTSENDSAYFTTATGLSLVAREGDAAPGSTGVFGNINNDALINDDGEVLFDNSLRNAPAGQNQGYWSTAGGGVLRPVFIAGDPVPGAEAETTFRVSSALPLSRTWVLNQRGNIAFVAQMEGPEVDGSNDLGLFVEVRGELAMLLREGDTIEVAPGDVRTVEVFSANNILGIAGGTGNGDGRPSAFNNEDQLAVAIEFLGTGGSGIFVIDDVELNVAGNTMQPLMYLDADGHPTIDYTVLPGLEYSIQRASDLTDPGSAISVSPATTPPLKERRTFTDDSITIDPGASIGPASGFYFLRYEKMP